MSQQSRNMNATEPSFGQKVRWPLIVIGLLSSHVALMMLGVSWALANASSFATPTVDKDSMSWGEQQQALLESKKLGWELRAIPSVMTEINGDRQIKFELLDSEGQPVRTDDLTINLYHPAEADNTITRKLAPGDNGQYVVTLPMRRSGSWHLQATANQTIDGIEKSFFSEQDFWIAPLGKPLPQQGTQQGIKP